MKKYFILIVMCVQGISLARGENQLLSTAVGKSMECIAGATQQFSMETCQEMLRPGNDNSLKKYDECKCIAACIAKRMELMQEKGEYDIEKLKKYMASMGSGTLVNEANGILAKCKNIKNNGNDCDYVFKWMICAFKNSKMVEQLMKSFMGGGMNSMMGGGMNGMKMEHKQTK